MIKPTEVSPFAQLVQKLAPASQLLRAWPLTGGVSAAVTALELAHLNGQTQKLVVRQHGAVDRQRNPQIAADEFTLLQFLQAHGVAVPKPVAFDQSGTIFPTPYLVVEYVEGESRSMPGDFDGLLVPCATELAKIHAIVAAAQALPFLPHQAEFYTQKLNERPAKLDDALDEGRIRNALEAVWPLPQHNPSVLLHGDFWPGNLLWRDGQLVAIIDWEDAAIGDPLADVANSRLEFLWAFGSDAMQRFTEAYQARTTLDFTNLPYWDLCAALRPASKLATWRLDAATEQAMRADHRWFVNQAFAKLAQ